MSCSGKPQLLYIDLKARGECIRLLYKHAGVEFEDKRFPFSDLAKVASNPDLCPLGYVPVLKTPCGQQISQTTTIIRYVAAELGLYGKNHLERAFMDTVIVSNKEIQDDYITINFFTPDDLKKAELLVALDKKINRFFSYYEKLIKDSVGDFIASDKISVADVFLVDVIDNLSQIYPHNKYLETYPLLGKAHSKTLECDNLKKYIASRKN